MSLLGYTIVLRKLLDIFPCVCTSVDSLNKFRILYILYTGYSTYRVSGCHISTRGCLSFLEDIQTIWSFTASFIFFWFYCVSLYTVYGYMFCMLLFNFVYYVFLLLRMFRSRYCLLLCCSKYCLCVNVYCTTPPGVNPIAVNEYVSYQSYHIISYHIISYHIISYHIISYHII
jgi:hypothetical protein